jgi:hypothetical protein
MRNVPAIASCAFTQAVIHSLVVQSRHASLWVVASIYGLAALTILLVVFPPVMDFPNHLARIWLLAGHADTVPLSAFYQVDWTRTSTNILVDFVASGMARILPIFVVGKILLLVLFLGPALGGVFLNRAIFGRSGVWALSFVLLIWSTTSVAGFLAYQSGIAAAPFAAVLVLRLWDSRGAAVALAAHATAAALLFAIHPFGLFFYAVVLCGLTIGRVLPPLEDRVAYMAILRKIVWIGIIAMLPVAMLIVFSHHPLQKSEQGTGRIWWDHPLLQPGRVIRIAISPLAAYDLVADLAIAAPILALTAIMLAARRCRFHAGLLIVMAPLTVLAIVMPSTIGEASWLTRRIPLMIAILLLAAVSPAFEARPARWIAAVVLIAVAIVRISFIADIWMRRDEDTRALFVAARVLPAGASVLLARQFNDPARAPVGRIMEGGPGGPQETQRHFGALLVIARSVFVPTLFTIAGQQPLAVRPAWRPLSVTHSAIPFLSMLGHANSKDPYVRDWRTFDYVVVTGSPRRPGAISSPEAQLVSPSSDFIEIYRVRHGASRSVISPRPKS